MKNYIKYILVLLVGLAGGWLLFHTPNTNTEHTHHTEQETGVTIYTCSMHPQIRQNEPGDCPICGMELIPADTANATMASNQFELTPTAMALANIETTIVGNAERGNSLISIPGSIVANEEATGTQISYFPGRIEKLYINYTGQEVHAGQLLARIYAPELITAQQELLTALKLKDNNNALYEAVRKKLVLLKISEKQLDQIEKSGKVITNFPIYATVSGTITKLEVAEGDQVKKGQTLFTLANLNSVWASFKVYEQDLQKIQKGQEITITSSAYPGKEFNEKVSFIDPLLTNNSRTVTLRTTLANTKGIWKPGMLLQGKISVSMGSTETIVVPASSVLWTGKRSLVYVKVSTEKPVFEKREVTLGNRLGNQYEIISGLSAGDEVVTNGTFTVDAAAQLQGKPSMMTLEKQDSTVHDHNMHMNMNTITQPKNVKLSIQQQQQFDALLKSYLEVKNELVHDNGEQAKQKVAPLLTNLTKINLTNASMEITMYWERAQEKLKNYITALQKQQTIDEQRKVFLNLSDEMINVFKTFHVDTKVYVQFCPMANNNHGGYWLSSSEKIENPYYGKSMLTCGETKEILE